ncbi:MAG: Holliday junction resolvase RuvX [Bacteroidota bacterium]
MGRLIAIDYGTKRVGLACTDPLKMIASPLHSLHAKDTIAWLKAYAAAEPVDGFVLGMPLNTDNTDTNSTPHVRIFAKLLAKAIPEIPIYLQDERYTTVLAHRTLLEAGLKKKVRADKGLIDRTGAVFILQGYMQKMGM